MIQPPDALSRAAAALVALWALMGIPGQAPAQTLGIGQGYGVSMPSLMGPTNQITNTLGRRFVTNTQNSGAFTSGGGLGTSTGLTGLGALGSRGSRATGDRFQDRLDAGRIQDGLGYGGYGRSTLIRRYSSPSLPRTNNYYGAFLPEVGAPTPEWLRPDIVVRAPSPLSDTTGAAGTSVESMSKQTAAMEERTLADVIAGYVQQNRSRYLRRAWDDFGDGKYRQACDLFRLSESVSTGDKAAMIESRIGLLHAAVASQQHAMAISCLSRLLSTDPATGAPLAPDLFDRIGNVRSLYGRGEAGQKEYLDHVASVQALEKRTSEALENAKAEARKNGTPDDVPTATVDADIHAKALLVVVLWGRDRGTAEAVADKIPPTKPPWSNIPKMKMMQETGQSGVLVTNSPPAVTIGPNSAPSFRLPFELGDDSRVTQRP